MTRASRLLLLGVGLTLFAGCDESHDGEEETVIADAGKADGFFPPTDFPGTDTHCNGVFSNCDREAAFGEGRWGSLGAHADGRAEAGDEVMVRAFIESDELSRVRTRLYFSPEPISRLDEAEQIGVLEATGTRTGFGGNGMEVKLVTTVESHMLEGGRLDGVFYVAFSGTDGIIRAVDVD